MDSIKAISFDLDDTLWSIDPVIKNAQEKIKNHILNNFHRFQPETIDEEFDESLVIVRNSYPDILYNLTELRRLSFEVMLIRYNYDIHSSHDLIETFLQFRHEVEIYPDVFECLEPLSKKYKIASLTNGNADVMRLSIGKHFSAHVCSEEVGVRKPDQKIFSKLTDLLDISPEFILHVGDNPQEDVIGAKEAGLQSVWMNRFQKEWPLQQKDTQEVCNLYQLIELL